MDSRGANGVGVCKLRAILNCRCDGTPTSIPTEMQISALVGTGKRQSNAVIFITIRMCEAGVAAKRQLRKGELSSAYPRGSYSLHRQRTSSHPEEGGVGMNSQRSSQCCRTMQSRRKLSAQIHERVPVALKWLVPTVRGTCGVVAPRPQLEHTCSISAHGSSSRTAIP